MADFCGYNISFQIASMIFVLILMIVFYSKKQFPSPANSLFRIVMALTFAELLFDALSVITITKFINGDESIFALNNFISKMYLILMVAYICIIAIYCVVNTIYKKISEKLMFVKYIEIILCIIGFIVATVIITVNPLLYGGVGSRIYSYGIPSDVVYIYSTVAVVACVTLLIFNVKKVSIKRLVPIIAFCTMEGAIAIIQSFNKELLLVGFGSALVLLIMYFALENPDVNMIKELNKANKRSRDLLLNVLPISVADKLEIKWEPFFEEYENVSVMFVDIVEFTKLSTEIGGTTLVKILNDFFTELDDLLENFRLEKIKTVGDAYMVVAGVPLYYEDNCDEIIKFARQVLRLLKQFNKKKNLNLQVRIGVNNGRMVAGVIGKKKFIFDVWGEAVNYAARLESNGVPGRINVSESVHYILGDRYEYEEKESSMVKGYGNIKSYLLV